MSAPKPVESTQPWQVYQDLVARDRHPPPQDLREASAVDLGVSGLDRTIYTSREFLQRELTHLWPRVWQFACREEEIPTPGDISLYELADYSFILVRTEDKGIKGFYNSCTHRGTRICAAATHLKELRCPFHGFSWNLDGSLKNVPCKWDFPHVTNTTHRLQEVRVGTWGGFVFINMDPDAPSLESWLEDLPAHLAAVDFANCYIAAYYRKTLSANWKTAIETFIEAYHVAETHPQTLSFADEEHSQYDVFPGRRNTSRFIEPIGLPSPAWKRPSTEQETLERLFAKTMGPGATAPRVPPGATARAVLAEGVRAQLTAAGRDVSALSDTELLDAIQYSLFPNMVLFRSVGFPLVYRFLPNRHDPDSCLFDMLIMRPVAPGQPRPAAAEPVQMGDMRYSDIPELAPWLGEIYDQDVNNLVLLSQGIRAGRTPITLSRYQEIRIRHFHQTLQRYLPTT